MVYFCVEQLNNSCSASNAAKKTPPQRVVADPTRCTIVNESREPLESHSIYLHSAHTMGTCRICLEEGGHTFCKCSGTSALVHEECLLKWLHVSKRKRCEICKEPFAFEEIQVCAPVCRTDKKDVLLARDEMVGCFVVVFSVGSTIAVFFMNILTAFYMAGFIVSHILILAVVGFFYADLYPVNTFVFMQCVSTIGQCIVAFDAGAAKLQDDIIVGNLQGFCMFGAIALWFMSVVYRHCTTTRQKLIMVYTSTLNPLNDVVTSTYTRDPPEEGRSPHAAKKETV